MESGQYLPLGPQWDCIYELLEAMPKQLLAQAASQVGTGVWASLWLVEAWSKAPASPPPYNAC